MSKRILLLPFLLLIPISGCSTFTNSMSGMKMGWTKPKKSQLAVGSADIPTPTKLRNPSKIHLAYAGWHEQNGNYAEARTEYFKVLEKNPKDLEALLGLARIDQMYDRVDECDQHLAKALKLYPKEPKVFLAIGQAHAARKDWTVALENLRTAQKMAPFEPIYDFHLAVAEVGAGEVDAGLAHFIRTVGEADAHFNVAQIQMRQGNMVEAEKHLVKATKLKPEFRRAELALAEARAANADRIQPASFDERARR